MPDPDYKALCAELVDIATAHCHPDDDAVGYCAAVLSRAALEAQPEPQGPTDEELLELSAHHGVSYTMSSGEVVYPMQQGCDMRDDVLSFAHAVLARWGRPATTGEQQ